VAVHHGLLHRVQAAIGALQAFHGFDRLAIQGRQQMDAAVDGAVIHPLASSVELAHHDHASAAIAFGAALLGAGALQLLAQVI
jgi:hypothetical protein